MVRRSPLAPLESKSCAAKERPPEIDVPVSFMSGAAASFAAKASASAPPASTVQGTTMIW